MTGVLSHTLARTLTHYIDPYVYADILSRYWDVLDKKLLAELVPAPRFANILSKDSINTRKVQDEDGKIYHELIRIMGHCVYALSPEASQATLRHRSIVRLVRGAFIPLLLLSLLLLFWEPLRCHSWLARYAPSILLALIAFFCARAYMQRLSRFSQSRVMGFLIYQHRWTYKEAKSSS